MVNHFHSMYKAAASTIRSDRKLKQREEGLIESPWGIETAISPNTRTVTSPRTWFQVQQFPEAEPNRAM